jgi:phosphate transport system permease protein
VAAWVTGITVCLVTAAIVVYFAVQGTKFLNIDLLTQHPELSLKQTKTGGFLDPIEGTLILTILGTMIALPLGVGIAIWLSEFGRPAGLARAVESGVEMVAGAPSIVLALFGLALFSEGVFGFLSFSSSSGSVYGRSFFVAGIMMSLIALPLIVAATRESLQSIPAHVREASYALGKNKWATIRRVLLPASRRGILSGTALGMGRIIGDTAIVVILLGGTLRIQGADTGAPGFLDTLKGTGGTLTSYVYNNSPAGEGGAYEKAYAAAFVLLMIVLVLNMAVGLLGRRGKEHGWTR